MSYFISLTTKHLVPVGGVSFVILVLFLHVETSKTPFLAGLRSVDWSGALLIIGGTIMFLFGLEFGGVSHPWDSPTVICLIIFGVFVWALAMLNEWKVAKYPIIPVRLFKNRHNVVMLLICFCHGFVFIATSYYLPLYFQSVLLSTPILSGVYVLPIVISLSLVSICVGVIMRKTGRYREPIIFGMIFMALGVGLFIDLKSYASWSRIIVYQIIAGIGVGPNFQAPLVAFQANILPSDTATATATFGFVRQLSTSISVVLGSVIYQNILGQQMPRITEAIGPEKASKLAGSFAGADKAVIRSLSESQKRVVLDAFTYALSRMWIFYTAFVGLGLLLSLLVRPIELSKVNFKGTIGLEEHERARQKILDAEKNKTDPQP